ncbi:MAG: DUF2207 domain-containing protein [Atopobium sp.]|uniref:DUF2207 domain-containing protein n=1 Tax=Atopobium sp. TaxID=1872650 RepID=UPI002A7F0A68|nr:DUF2207 domain-containing protein [Atopobium sp.]MDY4522688.1 DUF2207 domain-containing protein [Atopobium sp.]
MKKHFSFVRASFALALCCLLTIPAVLFGLPSQALAKDYRIDQVNINATVNPDGSMDVVENRTFDFDGKFNGVYWKIPEGTYKGRAITVTDIKAGLAQQGSLTPSTQFEQNDSEDNQTFQVLSENGVKRVKIFYQVRDEKQSYLISYRINNAVSAWSDCAELYWKFVSDGWDVPSNKVTCTIHLPVPEGQTVIPKDNVRAWGHGALTGTVTQSEDKKGVVFKVDTVGSSEFAESRITFPTSWVSGVTASSEAKLDSIIAEETAWANKANQERQRLREQQRQREATTRHFANVLTPIFVVGVPLVCVLMGFFAHATYARYRRLHDPLFKGSYFRDVPSSDNPVVYSIFQNSGNVKSKFLTTAIMQLSAKKALRIDKIEGEYGGSSWALTALKDYDDLSDPIDRATYKFLFKKVAQAAQHSNDGAQKTLLMSALEEVAKEDSENYTEWINSWSAKAETTAYAKGYFDDTHSNRVWLMILLGILVLVVSFILMIAALPFIFSDWGNLLGSFAWLWPLYAVLVIGTVAWIGFQAHKMRSLSAEGVELNAKLQALKRWFSDFTRLDEAVPNDVVLWSKLLVIAVALGVSKKVLEQIRVALPRYVDDVDTIPTFIWLNSYGWDDPPLSSLDHSITSGAMASAIASSLDSSGDGDFGGGGGGFSGGGGGGFGGGGGGGAF